MSTALQEHSRATGLTAWIDNPKAHARIDAAVGDVMETDQFIAHMLTAFQSPEVRGCTDQSKFTALHECAALGLLPTLNQVKLIPYKDQLKAMPQWQGYKALMERHPSILEVSGCLVHVADKFAFENGEPRHTYDPFDASRDIKNGKDIKGGYCKIVYSDGRPPKYHMVTVRQIEKARGCAQTQNVWGKWYEQMALKTLYRDCYARRAVPIDPLVYSRLQKVLKLDDINMGNDPLRIESESTETNRCSKSDHLAGQLKLQGTTAEDKEPPVIDVAAEHPQSPDATTELQETKPEPEPTGDPSADADLINEFADQVKQVATVGTVSKLVADYQEIATTDEARAKIQFHGDVRIKQIRGSRGPGSNQQKSAFDTGESATEAGA